MAICASTWNRGKHAEQRISWSEVDPIEDGLNFSQKIRMRQHHAFRIGRCARGVNQRSEIIVVRRRGLELARPSVENGGQIRQPMLLNGMAGHPLRIHQDEAEMQFLGRGPRHGNMLGVDEHRRCAAVLEQLRDLIVVQCGIEGHGGAA